LGIITPTRVAVQKYILLLYSALQLCPLQSLIDFPGLSRSGGREQKKENLHFFKKNRKNGDFIDKTQVMGISRILSPQGVAS